MLFCGSWVKPGRTEENLYFITLCVCVCVCACTAVTLWWTPRHVHTTFVSPRTARWLSFINLFPCAIPHMRPLPSCLEQKGSVTAETCDTHHWTQRWLLLSCALLCTKPTAYPYTCKKEVFLYKPLNDQICRVIPPSRPVVFSIRCWGDKGCPFKVAILNTFLTCCIRQQGQMNTFLSQTL